ncbi:broad-complex core protein isoforms 1/2/3/4/5-like isoform X3 [Schistocerca gregaria]|uniref:broad-complex core protein isoforms 1/2/3/4/5-like isoform X3 n=1 Tax=Schistocerca gregaria TaxID=7010 RepID=UPI00211F3EB2|nr:broad-complex core protein isoforms 1/2/3/4/5-like isoform X3 [Schistocerca gregaria]XP_049854373.1 broad-complex core protein isoforms 1/2/3/4/5-like isoform X3 [Schistocerca gregaria]
MGSSQQFSLRWNNYLNHITGAFDTLRNDDELVDVTLSCEGKRIKAHKMLLSVCSTYFRDLFKENPCQHPVIIFRNVKFEDLVALIDFMYHGEVNVMQEQLTSFLTTAELLAVQGLSEDKGKEKERDSSPLPESEVDLTDSPPPPPPPPPPVHETEGSVSNSGHIGLLRHNRQRTSSPRSPPQAPAFFPTTSNIERRPESPPNKRRRWSSTQQPIAKPAAVSVTSRKCDDEGSGSPPPPPSPARRPVTDQTPDTTEIVPPTSNPPVKMEMPDYVDESRTRADQGQMPSGTAVENDSLASMAQLVAAKTEGASSPTQGVSSAPPDLSDLYGGSSRDAGATSDSLSAVELSQILAKPGPSGESQSQDSLQVSLLHHLIETDLSSSAADVPSDHSCNVCGQVFGRKDSLAHHRNIHRGLTRCPVCSKVFSRRYTMVSHALIAHGVTLSNQSTLKYSLIQ